MTNDDLSTLEHDLLELASPSPRDAAYRRALRDELAARVRPLPTATRRPRRTRRPLFAAAAGIAAAAAVAIAIVLALGGTGGTEPAAAGVLDHARQALTPPPNTIVHVRLVGRGGVDHESWQLTSPPYSGRWTGTLGGGPESADDGTKQYIYDERAKAIHTRPSPEPLWLSGPLSQIRADLASGRARLVGTTALDGARV
jgi:hypothetical protein